ncbi:MAG: hypothetical protein PUF61_04055 [Spirochaetales bacterium]|nr:hypothetical protein [Spirochaetales bacterium]
MVLENEFKQNRNTVYLAALILDDFIAHKFNGQNNNLNVKSNLLPNKNYIINLNEFRNYRPNYGLGSKILNTLFNSKEPDSLDFTDFNKDLLLKIIRSSLEYTDLELHSDDVLELKLPQVSY